MKRILVTGATGFIGSHLVKALSGGGGGVATTDWVIGVSRKAGKYPYDLREPEANNYYGPYRGDVYCDLTLEAQVASLMLRFKPDVVFHLAGHSTIREQGSFVSLANVVATHHLLRYAPRGCRFVLASSAAVYGDAAGRGNFVPEFSDKRPNSVYGATKLAAEHLVEAYTALGLVRGLSLRYVANVGAGATHGVVRDLIAKLKSDSPNLELLGARPGSTKHYTHVCDTVDATVKLGLGTAETGAVNVCNDDVLNVEDLAEQVMNSAGIRKPVRWLGERANWAGDNRFVRVCNMRAACLGWRPSIPCSADAVARAVGEMMAA